MKVKIRLWLRSFRNGMLIIFIPIIIAIILRVFFVEIYKIPSASMEPALLPGDVIMVSKMSYGARVLRPARFFKQKKVEYIRTKGWSYLKKGDVFVFNWPQYKMFADSGATIYGDCVVKRCYGMPGDSVWINNERMKELKNEGMNNEISWNIQKKSVLFPHDSTLIWSLDKYGPLYVPAKGKIMELTKKRVAWYKDVLLYENPGKQIKDSCLVTKDGEKILQYTFKHNYYFMLGDNFYHSEDSRYWGFVPDNNIIGKTVVVLFSIDQNEYGFKKIRWNRIMKIFKNNNHETNI